VPSELFHVRLDPDTADWVHAQAERRGISVSEFLRLAISRVKAGTPK
jgi:hypothetical protein